METPLVLGITSFLAALFVILGLWQRRITAAQKKQLVSHIREANDLGTQRPLGQHPQIDALNCIGCQSCVKACPESGVLGIVDGVSRVIHGARCIGHGKCAEVCPVGALTVGLGDVSSRPDIPILTDTLETSVPGIYIAGELGGYALIHNAIRQGTSVVDDIARGIAAKGRASGGPDAVDVLIVGAGPAGIAATLKAKERGLTVRTIEQETLGGTVRKYPRRKLTMTQPANLPLYGRTKRYDYFKEELIELWEQIARDFDLPIEQQVKLLGLEPRAGYHAAETSRGSVVARNVVLALGRRGTPRKLGVPGEESEKVLYQLLDAASYSGQHLLVVGGGDSAIEAAVALATQPGNVVTLSYRKPNFFRLKPRNEQSVREFTEKKRLRVVFSSSVERIEEETVHLNVNKGDVVKVVPVKNDQVFVFAGGEPPYPLLKRMGIRFGGEDAPDKAEVAQATVARR